MMTQIELMRENGRLRAALQRTMLGTGKVLRYGWFAPYAVQVELEAMYDISRSALTGNELASDLARCEG